MSKILPNGLYVSVPGEGIPPYRVTSNVKSSLLGPGLAGAKSKSVNATLEV